MHPSGQKRLDLQGIRGIAIASVLGFHFYPKVFPNGYLGVDQFFVLSGFLMQMLLTRAQSHCQNSQFSITWNFYIRRLKRILHLYSLTIFLTLLSISNILSQSFALNQELREQNQKSALKAMLFVSNRRHTDEENYFEKLRVGIDLFTHTWSLSVEVQFYAIVPFIYFGASCFWNLGLYILIGLLSFSYHCFLPSEDAFNNTFSRIWQFLIGMIISLISMNFENKNHDDTDTKISLLDEENQSSKSNHPEEPESRFQIFFRFFFLILVLAILICPIVISPVFARPIFTISTGVLMLFSSKDREFLTFKVLTYLGDISYSLYLVHWPILAYIKLYYQDGKGYDIYYLFAGILISVIVAVAIFEGFERWHLKLRPSLSFLLVIIITSLSVYLIYFNDNNMEINNIRRVNDTLDGVTKDMTLKDAEIKNKYWNTNDVYSAEMNEPGCVKRKGSKYEYTWCDYQGNGTEFKIAIFGNSYARNHAKMIIQECRHRALNISLDNIPACEPLANSSSHGYHCTPALSNFVEFIEDTKPDYAFLMTRHISVSDNFTNGPENLDQDDTYILMRKQLRKIIPNIKRKLFILDSFPRIVEQEMKTVVDSIRIGMSFEQISKYTVTDTDFLRGRIRHAALIKECGDKCELIDYYPLFLKNSKYRKNSTFTQYFDDRGFIYFTDHNHLSAHGLEFVRPIYTEICHNKL